MNGQIEDYISHDRENPTTKRQLVAATGLTERNARARISTARRRGIPIIGLLTGGYYIADGDPDAWQKFCSQERRRAIATFKKAGLLDAGAAGQMTVFDISVPHEREGPSESVVEATGGAPRSIQTSER